MKKTNIYVTFCLLGFLFLTFSGCSDDDDLNGGMQPAPELIAGEADFSNYVAIGNSLTAGFTDGALFIAGQQNSLPNTLSKQFALVGGNILTNPLMNDNIGGLLIGGQTTEEAAPRYYFNGVVPVRLDATPTTEALNNLGGTFTNMGVPGAKSFHLLYDGYGNPGNIALGLANPYFVRFASAPNATIIGDAIAQNPTFFSLMTGNQDALGYAFEGGDANIDALTDPATFALSFETAVSILTSGGAKGVVTNVPDVGDLVHFNIVPYNPLDPTDEAFGPQIPTLNAIFGAINDVYAFLGVNGRDIVFSTTEASAVVINDETLPDLSAQIEAVLNGSPTFPVFVQSFGLPAEAAPLVAQLLGQTYGQARQATEEDKLTLSSSTVIGNVNSDVFDFLVSQGLPPTLAGQFAVNGITNPLADRWVLIPSELSEISSTIGVYNSSINAVASQNGLAVVDLNSALQELNTVGISDGDFVLTDGFVTGGFFSLDGIHPNSRGYAVMANLFLKAIDATYGSNFEASGNLVDIGNYPTNYPPTLQ